jgi:YD repeat-containing protein
LLFSNEPLAKNDIVLLLKRVGVLSGLQEGTVSKVALRRKMQMLKLLQEKTFYFLGLSLVIIMAISSLNLWAVVVTEDTAYESFSAVQSIPPYHSDFPGERFDLRSGGVHHETEILTLPGAGGFDLTLYRSLDKHREYGYRLLKNWELEIPRIVLAGKWDGSVNYVDSNFNGQIGTLCSTPASIEVVETNTSYKKVDFRSGLHLIIPGAEPKALLRNVNDNISPAFRWITTDNWGVTCINNGNGFIVYSPSGNRYTITKKGYDTGIQSTYFYGTGVTRGSRADITVYADSVEDSSGNRIDYTYDFITVAGRIESNGLQRPLIRSIQASDGRLIRFNYTPGALPYIDNIEVNGARWRFDYDTSYLIHARDPDENTYSYKYEGPVFEANYPYYYTAENKKGWRRLSYAKSPLGLTIDYSYQLKKAQDFGLLYLGSTAINVVKSRSINQGTHLQYQFSLVNNRNVTDVSGDREEHYEFSRDPKLFGALLKKQIKASGNILRTTDYAWEATGMWGGYWSEWGQSNFILGIYSGGENKRQLSSVTIDNLFKTEYSEYNSFGQPRRITESGTTGALVKKRVTILRYDNFVPTELGPNFHGPILDDLDKKPMHLGLINHTHLLGTIDKRYNLKGQLEYVNRFGVEREFRYHNSGDLYKEIYQQTSGGSKIEVVYSDYKMGIPRLIQQPEAINIVRSVNDFGQIESTTDGEGNTTVKSLSPSGRLERLEIQGQSPIIFDWLNQNQVTESQNLRRTVKKYDGYGRLVEQNIFSQLKPAESVRHNWVYDKFGNLYSETSQGGVAVSTADAIVFGGSSEVNYRYDKLGRLVKRWNSDEPGKEELYYYDADWNAAKDPLDPSITFGVGIAFSDTNGVKSKKRIFEHSAYGDPDRRIVNKQYIQSRAASDVGGLHYIESRYDYDLLGNIQSIDQGGFTRRYYYYPNQPSRLEREVHPEIGTVAYTYDLQGNVKSKNVGGNITTYIYDDLNRLESVDYPSTTPDLINQYYKNSQLKNIKLGDVAWDYTYNAAGQLRTEELSIDSKKFKMEYWYDTSGAKEKMMYPNGEVVEYSPNWLGKPTKIGKYALNAKYFINGNLARLEYGNGVSLINTPDSRLRIAGNVIKGGNGTDILSRTYSYDWHDNMVAKVDQLHPENSVNVTLDQAHRVISAASGLWSGNGIISYDDLGNISSKSFEGSHVNYSYDPSTNRLMSMTNGYVFGYDIYGNVSANGKNTFKYNDAGALVEVNGGSGFRYTYDGHGHRVKDTKIGGDTSYSAYSMTGQLIYKYNDTKKVAENYFYLGSTLISKNTDCSANDSDQDGIPDCVEDEWGLNRFDSKDALADLDQDGVPNVFEYVYNLNPRSAITGKNGVSDFVLLSNNINGIYDGDMDGDGLSDYREFIARANIMNADTDSDGLPDGVDGNPTFNVALLIPILYSILH